MFSACSRSLGSEVKASGGCIRQAARGWLKSSHHAALGCPCDLMLPRLKLRSGQAKIHRLTLRREFSCPARYRWDLACVLTSQSSAAPVVNCFSLIQHSLGNVFPLSPPLWGSRSFPALPMVQPINEVVEIFTFFQNSFPWHPQLAVELQLPPLP